VKKNLISRIPRAERWVYRNDKVLRSIHRGLSQARRMQLVPVNGQNKFEVPIARRLGAKLTHGSGSVNGDGDMRLNGRFLIEHKSRAGKVVSIPVKVFLKIRKAAGSRNLTPVLIVSSREYPGQDVVIMTTGDAFALFPNGCLCPDRRKWKQIHIDFPELNVIWLQKTSTSVPLRSQEIHGLQYHLSMISISDFKSITHQAA
jgi:hypothetical protein